MKVFCNGLYIENDKIFRADNNEEVYTIDRDCSMSELYRKMQELRKELKLKAVRSTKAPL